MTQTPDVTHDAAEAAGASPEVMIRLESLTKRYPGQAAAAVDNVTR